MPAGNDAGVYYQDSFITKARQDFVGAQKSTNPAQPNRHAG
jgi:hypothetical protein